jgi:hypothetical protein
MYRFLTLYNAEIRLETVGNVGDKSTVFLRLVRPSPPHVITA